MHCLMRPDRLNVIKKYYQISSSVVAAQRLSATELSSSEENIAAIAVSIGDKPNL